MSGSTLRNASVNRATKETDIELNLGIDGSGQVDISTGVGFMDHMLTLFGVHGFLDLQIKAIGDLEVDGHHTVEDVGICLGQAFSQALDDKSGIVRYGHSYVPMDETLARVCVDFSNRPYLHYDVELHDRKIGNFDTPLAKEFLRAFSLHAGITMHVDLLHGENSHHILEAVFKALGRAVAQAVRVDEKISGHMSSKGTL